MPLGEGLSLSSNAGKRDIHAVVLLLACLALHLSARKWLCDGNSGYDPIQVTIGHRENQWVNNTFIPCVRMVNLFAEKDPWPLNVTCLRIPWGMGRYGNQVIAVMRSVQIARMVGLKRIKIGVGYSGITRNVTFTDGLKIEMDIPYNKERCVNRYMFYRINNVPYLNTTIDPDLHKVLLSFQKIEKVPDDHLVIHLRSGDVFSHTFISYSQPSCPYYGEVMAMRNWSKVRIIAEDDKNPCVGWIRERGGIFEKRKWPDDLSTLLGARNLVIGRGSLGFALAFLSTRLVRLYTFNATSSRIMDHMNCVPTDEYYNQVIKRWWCSKKQFGLMLSNRSKCERWDFIQRGDPRFSDLYLHENNV